MRGVMGAEGQGDRSDPFRVCGDCHRAKTVRGVWYLVPGRGAQPFVCETCFGIVRAAPITV